MSGTDGTDGSTADDIRRRQNGGTNDKNSAKIIPEHKIRGIVN